MPLPPPPVVLVVLGGGRLPPASSPTAVRPLPSQHRAMPSSLSAVTRSRSQMTERSRVKAADEEEMTVEEVIEVIDMLRL